MSKQERKSAAKAITDSAHQIWLAGLGAFAKAQAEGSRVFEQLIQDGTELDQKTRKYTKDHLAQLRETMERGAERLFTGSRTTLEGLHERIDQRVADAMERMVAPTRQELSRLADRLEALSAHLNVPDMPPAESSAPEPAPKAARPAARKSATRTQSTAAKKTSTQPAAKKPARKAAAKKPTHPA